jgi:hypothetical protein
MGEMENKNYDQQEDYKKIYAKQFKDEYNVKTISDIKELMQKIFKFSMEIFTISSPKVSRVICYVLTSYL